MHTCKINLQPLSQRGKCSQNHSLLEFTQDMGVNLVGLCGGVGTCGRCKIQIMSGRVSDPTPSEKKKLTKNEINEGFRLACQTKPESDLIVNIPSESLSAPQRLQVDGIKINIRPEPFVRAFGISVNPPSLTDTRGDDARVFDALSAQHGISCRDMDTELLRTLPHTLREFKWELNVCVRNHEIIDATPKGKPCLGMAFDLGTTKIAGYLFDLETGSMLTSSGEMNPQIAYGEDVIARITRAVSDPEEAAKLQEVVINTLNKLADELCVTAGLEAENIMDMVVVGNTAMHHLLLRLPVDPLGRAPHIAAVSHARDIKARELGLCFSKGAYVHLPPNIAGFVGGDHVAMLLGIDAGNTEGPLLAVDIGTNTEISLIVHKKISSVSCASGPAFEGYHIKCGMRAADGAIEHVKIDNNEIQYQTIYGSAPVGICGSGIFDTMAQFYLNGIMNKTGRMTPDHPRVQKNGDSLEFVLVPEGENNAKKPITITQKDLRELQLAKAAIRTGIDTLLKKHHMKGEEINQVVVAGAFGNFIDIASAIAIGMFPNLPLNRFRQVGNAAGSGAGLALVSRSKREEAVRMAERIEYVELAGTADFNRNFIKALDME